LIPTVYVLNDYLLHISSLNCIYKQFLFIHGY